MLQQTTVAATIPYYEKFLIRFPTIRRWPPRRWRTCSRPGPGLATTPAPAICTPVPARWLRRAGFHAIWPGCVRCRGSAITPPRQSAAIAFGVPAVPVDGNVERVVARLFAVDEQLPKAKPLLRELAARLGDHPAARARPSDFAQALFDLGATVCTPATPACALCPWMADCAGRRAGIAAELPRRAAKRERPRGHGVHFWLTDADDNVLLRRRPPEGLLGGMTELPGTDWRADGGTSRRRWRSRRCRPHGSRPARCATASPISS